MFMTYLAKSPPELLEFEAEAGEEEDEGDGKDLDRPLRPQDAPVLADLGLEPREDDGEDEAEEEPVLLEDPLRVSLELEHGT